VRAFVAIDIPPLDASIPPELRPEDHMTLHFFEELPTARIPLVLQAMTEAVAGIAPFDVEVRGVGAFPTPERPRVVWAGIGEGAVPLQAVADRLRGALSVREFPVERRPFVPHLTLARVRSARGAIWSRQFLADPNNAARLWTRARVTELLLKESELLPTGARHLVRERVPLPGSLIPPSTLRESGEGPRSPPADLGED
jgi:RNA 2',3'-cyclic 3'-phosphodiesterase